MRFEPCRQNEISCVKYITTFHGIVMHAAFTGDWIVVFRWLLTFSISW